MQLRNARLCLDCEEVHDAQQCPLCASESFAFVTRWVPAPERRTQSRLAAAPPEALDSYRQLLAPEPTRASTNWRVVKGGAVGLALVGVAGWILKQKARTEND